MKVKTLFSVITFLIFVHIIYAQQEGDLLWYKHIGFQNGSVQWQGGFDFKVGVGGWDAFSHVFPTSGGVIYAVKTNGDLVWYKHTGQNDGSTRWEGGLNNKIGDGWNMFNKIFSTSNGIIYGVKANGDLHWYRHSGWNTGAVQWEGGGKIGDGWNMFDKIFTTDNGIIYGVKPNGDLHWYKHSGWNTGTAQWEGGGKIGDGWNAFTGLFATSNGVIYGVKTNGDLVWYKHLGYNNGSVTWQGGLEHKVGEGWQIFKNLYSPGNGIIYGIKGSRGNGSSINPITPNWSVHLLTQATVFTNENFQGTSTNIVNTTRGAQSLAQIGIPSVRSIKVAWGYKAIIKSGLSFSITNPVTGVTRRGEYRIDEIVGDREGGLPADIASIEIVTYTPLNGWVDMHTHPMSHLGFGKKLMHGAPDVGSLIPAGTRGCNPTDFRARTIQEALGNCNSTHGGWGTDNGCGNYVRAVVISKAFDNDFIHNVHHNPFEGGNLHGDHRHEGVETNPNFLYWPHQSSKAHQQMWWEWIKRAYKEGGLRVMVALTVNSELLAEVIDGDNPKDDKNSGDLQINEIKSFVGRHSDFMEVAYSANDLRRIVSADKLAVIIGMEVDNIGNFNKSNVICNDATVKAEIRRLFNAGVRYVFPIHLVDNKFGGAAVYEDLFNYANKYSAGSLFTVQSSSAVDPTITHRLGAGLDGYGNLGIKAALDGASTIPYPPAFHAFNCPIPTLGCWDKFKFIRELISPDTRYVTYGATTGGHMNAKGLTPLGEVAVKEMMRLGMVIDIDHMSQNSINKTLEIAEAAQYPVNIGHNGIREQSGDERSASRRTVERVAQLGGMFGVGTSDSEEANSDATTFIRNFQMVWSVMGNKSVAMGTDVNGMERLPRTSQGLNSDTFYSGFSPCRTGNRTWDYTKEGVAHYGLMADFVRDIRNRNASVHINLMKSSEYFAQMWEKCERQKTNIR